MQSTWKAKKNIILEAKKFVNRLLTPLENHYYHSYEHAVDVMQRAIYLAEKEWLNAEGIEVLALAGLFHDTWFVVEYDNNEEIWAKIAKNYLRSVWYDEEKIKLVERIIEATAPKYKNPKDIYEKIIKDADMDNLWRDDFLKRSNDIKREIETIKKIKIKDPEWHHSLVDLLIDYRFNTEYQKKERGEKKLKNLKEMLKEVKKDFKVSNKDLKWYIDL